MRVLLATTIVALILIWGCGQNKETKVEKADHSEHKMDLAADSSGAEEKLIYYTCPMKEHKHIHSAVPGICSECNMEMAAGVTTSKEKMEYYGCPMEIHSHVRSDKEGTCKDCGMDLKPMRLDKERKSKS